MQVRSILSPRYTICSSINPGHFDIFHKQISYSVDKAKKEKLAESIFKLTFHILWCLASVKLSSTSESIILLTETISLSGIENACINEPPNLRLIL